MILSDVPVPFSGALPMYQPTPGATAESTPSSVPTAASAPAPGSLASFAGQAAQIWQQIQFQRVQAKRAASGLPPLSADQYSAQYIPPAATVSLAVSTQLQSMLMWGGVAVAALVAVAIFSGRKR